MSIHKHSQENIAFHKSTQNQEPFSNLSITKYVFGLLCCLALTRGHGAQAGGHADGLVDDVLGPAGALRAVGQGLEAHPQLVADGPAVRVPP